MPTPLLNRQNFSQGVWAHAPNLENVFDPSLCASLNEDWQNYDATTTHTLTTVTTGSAAIDTTAPGRLLLNAGAATAGQGCNLQRKTSVWVPAANKSIWAEFLLTLTATSPPVTKAQLFVGLAASATAIMSAGAMNVSNYIGFQILTGGNLTASFGASKAGTGTTQTGATLVDSTQVKLGFHYRGSTDVLQPYVNGVPVGNPITTTNIPKSTALYPSFVVQSDGGGQVNGYLGAYQIIQLR